MSILDHSNNNILDFSAAGWISLSIIQDTVTEAQASESGYQHEKRLMHSLANHLKHVPLVLLMTQPLPNFVESIGVIAGMRCQNLFIVPFWSSTHILH